MSTDPSSRLGEIKARLENATPGPWQNRNPRIWGGQGLYDEVIAPGPVDCTTHCYGGTSQVELTETDAEFIAAAPVDVRWLLEHVEQQRAEVERWRGLHVDGCFQAVESLRHAVQQIGDAHDASMSEVAQLRRSRQIAIDLLNKHVDDIDLFVAVQIRAVLGAAGVGEQQGGQTDG